MSRRENLQLDAGIVSDSAPLNGLVAEILESGSRVHCMRDATRGGPGGRSSWSLPPSPERSWKSGRAISRLRESVRGLCEILGHRSPVSGQ